MKKTLNVFLLLILISCSNKITYYHGYIYNEKNEPLENLKIVEDDNLQSYSMTDQHGYFKILERNNYGGNLKVYTIDNVIIDTIWTVYSTHGEKLNYRFVNGRSDTLFISKKKHLDE